MQQAAPPDSDLLATRRALPDDSRLNRQRKAINAANELHSIRQIVYLELCVAKNLP
jgi:hypothetical protein